MANCRLAVVCVPCHGDGPFMFPSEGLVLAAKYFPSTSWQIMESDFYDRIDPWIEIHAQHDRRGLGGDFRLMFDGNSANQYEVADLLKLLIYTEET